MQQMVVRLAGTMRQEPPGKAMSGRIRTRLISEWNAEGYGKPKTSSLNTFLQSARPSRSWFSLRNLQRSYGPGIGIILFFVLFAFVYTSMLPSGAVQLPGAAWAVGKWVLFGVVTGVITLTAVVWYFWRGKR
jgi:hypothetical protein